MRKTVEINVGVKASGGVRTREDADKMVAAGAFALEQVLVLQSY